LRTGERYVVDDNGALFNESRNESARLHGNCEVRPIKQRKAQDMDVFKLIEEYGLTLHGDIEHFAELVRAKEREACIKICGEGTDEPLSVTALKICLKERNRIADAIRERGNE
jgi:hypothetical protein